MERQYDKKQNIVEREIMKMEGKEKLTEEFNRNCRIRREVTDRKERGQRTWSNNNTDCEVLQNVR